MGLGEFGVIERYFTRQSVNRSGTRLGVGDDCALLEVPAGYQLAVTTDTLVENVHFFSRVDPESLGHKALAVNLSDLAAMGAEPCWVCLALTLPHIDEDWLSAFSRGFLDLAARYRVELVGGDTTRGPLSLTVQAMGLVPAGQALTRGAASVGDVIYVTGCLGDAGLGLRIEEGFRCADSSSALARFHRPIPRVEAGVGLRSDIHACLDVSDGLAGDLGHILRASGVGARIDWDRLPLSGAVRHYVEETGDWRMPLIAGDDYELCFTVAPETTEVLESKARAVGVPCTAIGFVEHTPGLRLRRGGEVMDLLPSGYDHFGGEDDE